MPPKRYSTEPIVTKLRQNDRQHEKPFRGQLTVRCQTRRRTRARLGDSWDARDYTPAPAPVPPEDAGKTASKALVVLPLKLRPQTTKPKNTSGRLGDLQK